MKKLLTTLLLVISVGAIAQQTYLPDDVFENYLETNGLGNGIPNDDSVTTAVVSGLTDLFLSSTGIMDLTGLEDFTSLQIIDFSYNPITTANLSQNLALETVIFTGCDLITINVTQNSQLLELSCGSNDLTSLDVTNNPLLNELNCRSNNLNSLDLSQNTALTVLDVSINPLTGLDITQNTALLDLSCVQNTLTSLDVSQNTQLQFLDCRSNLLTALDVSQNTDLTTLFCRANSITALDVSSNPDLHSLNCTFNDLYCLNANNQNSFEDPANLGFYNFAASGNPNLSCIEVTNPSTAGSYYVHDATASFTSDCSPLVNTSVTQIGNQLTVELNSSIYQWVDCNDNFSSIPGETNQSFTPTVTGNYAAYITVVGDCGSTSTELSSCFYISFVGLEELANSEKELVKIIDFMGKETEFKSNVPLIFIYSDGSRERVMEIED